MPTEANSIRSRWISDSPWKRLPWTLPTAMLIWALTLCSFAYFMGKNTRQSVAPAPIDAQFVELPAPAAKQVERPVALHKSKPLPTPRPHQAPTVVQQTEQNPVAEKAEATPAAITPTVLSAGQSSSVSNTSVNTGTQAGSPGGKGTYGGNMYANGGARVILRPMPQIPDDLREEAFNSSALARFYVAADGSAKVELVKPTPNPRLNLILLNSLKKWRFMPAIKNGKPVASTEDVVVKIQVK